MRERLEGDGGYQARELNIFAYLALCKKGRLPDYSFHRGHVFNITRHFFQTWAGQDVSVIMSPDCV